MGVAAVTLLMLLTAPEPPGPDDTWRWATIGLGLAAGAWNLWRATVSFGRAGPLSLVGFFQLWMFFAFSFPAVEMTYRYDQLSLGYWRVATDSPVLFQAALLLAGFQVLFSLALGEGVDATVGRVVERCYARWPDQRVGVVFLVLLIPLALARVVVWQELGLSGIAASMVTRTDYLARLDNGINPVVWALNAVVPVYGVAFACLAVKYLVPHPSRLGRWLFLAVAVICTAGVAISGGRAELVLVGITVAVFMYVAGYRSLRSFAPALLPALLLAGLLFTVAQARHGEDNALSQAAEGTTVGADYSPGDVTQVLGLGRFDAMVMILDRQPEGAALLGDSYLGALSIGADATFLPQLALGVDLSAPTVSQTVLGPWVFADAQGSVLPSAPGEGYLNFGLAGALGSAVVLGLVLRGLVALASRLRVQQELTLLFIVWTTARLMSDEAALLASFVARNIPVVVIVLLVTAHTESTRAAPAGRVTHR